MTNHVHLLLTPVRDDSCARFMHGVGQRYATYFNRTYQRTGTLWEGRFKSCLVGSAAYVLACHRYIEMNPVRAGMVGEPAAYPWSSFACNAGIRTDPLVTTHPEAAAIGVAGYRALFDNETSDAVLAEIRDAVNCGYPLGSESFKQSVSVTTGRRTAKQKPGPKPISTEERSVAVPDLSSGGGAS
jgi:putative transposase